MASLLVLASLVSLTPSTTKIPISLTIFSKTSCHVWIGSGQTQAKFGGLCVSFPHKNNYDNSTLPTTSHLIGGDTNDETISLQIAQRISIKTEWPCLVSCDYEVDLKDDSGGMILKVIEKEIINIISEFKNK
ncbi:hypothetical protein TL16_g07418 [Triparma laevis f. inornata]|uniref:Uncharacterized protein n=1 Tax=Triparma laevis f. inornata TaxID=1714386 RepID=A0A9W7EG14_9STRA|nr:hypothetical protein TL16_g07418 [Triparma laevis f. inornata]